MARTLILVVRNLVFTIVVPGLGGVWVPWWILTRNGHAATAAAWEAVPVIAAGTAPRPQRCLSGRGLPRLTGHTPGAPPWPDRYGYGSEPIRHGPATGAGAAADRCFDIIVL